MSNRSQVETLPHLKKYTNECRAFLPISGCIQNDGVIIHPAPAAHDGVPKYVVLQALATILFVPLFMVSLL